VVAEVTQQVFPARAETLRDVLGFVTEARGWARLSDQRSNEFQLAIEEAFVNICRHGSATPVESVIVRVRASDDAVEVEIEDCGSPFNPLTAPAPTRPHGLEEAPIGGLGIQLMQRMADDIRYSRQQSRNILTLIVHTSSGGDS
jgi:anti-sigma regulatory factor (Ser/Thr protein kinase)